MKDLLNKENIMVVVGVSRDKAKWGYKVFAKLGELGFRVIPINPNCEQIDEIKCYPVLEEMMIEERDLDVSKVVVVTVVPPEVTLKIVEESLGLGVKMVWMQQGSESPEAVKRAEEGGIEVMAGACIVKDGLKGSWD